MPVRSRPGERVRENYNPPGTLGEGGATTMTGGQNDIAESGLKGGEGVLPRANGPLVGGTFQETKAVKSHDTEF